MYENTSYAHHGHECPRCEAPVRIEGEDYSEGVEIECGSCGATIEIAEVETCLFVRLRVDDSEQPEEDEEGDDGPMTLATYLEIRASQWPRGEGDLP